MDERAVEFARELDNAAAHHDNDLHQVAVNIRRILTAGSAGGAVACLTLIAGLVGKGKDFPVLLLFALAFFGLAALIAPQLHLLDALWHRKRQAFTIDFHVGAVEPWDLPPRYHGLQGWPAAWLLVQGLLFLAGAGSGIAALWGLTA